MLIMQNPIVQSCQFEFSVELYPEEGLKARLAYR